MKTKQRTAQHIELSVLDGFLTIHTTNQGHHILLGLNGDGPEYSLIDSKFTYGFMPESFRHIGAYKFEVN